MRNSSYYSATSEIRTSDLPHGMTTSKKVQSSYPLGRRGGFRMLVSHFKMAIVIIGSIKGNRATSIRSVVVRLAGFPFCTIPLLILSYVSPRDIRVPHNILEHVNRVYHKWSRCLIGLKYWLLGKMRYRASWLWVLFFNTRCRFNMLVKDAPNVCSRVCSMDTYPSS